MRRKSTTTGMMMDYIAQALLQLMETAPFAAITVQQIAARAGVNRSTYYRHFSGKEDVLLYYLDQLMTRYEAALPAAQFAGLQPYLEAQFAFFYQYKTQLLTIYDSGQILLFLQVLNRHLRSVPDLEHTDLLEKCRTAYHIGGIFNNYLLWLERRMQDSPQDMAAAAARILPQGFTPFLLR